MGDTSDHRVERLNGTGVHPVPWHDAGYETPKAPGWCVSADGRQAFERLVFRYGDPQRLERDLAELAEFRRRVAELSGASGVTVPRRSLWRLPDYALHRLGWGLFWRLGGFALVQLVWLPQVEWLALVGGLALFAVIGVPAHLWRRRGLGGTLWRIALVALLALLAVHLPTPIYMLAEGLGLLVMVSDVAWTVLWPEPPLRGTDAV